MGRSFRGRFGEASMHGSLLSSSAACMRQPCGMRRVTECVLCPLPSLVPSCLRAYLPSRPPGVCSQEDGKSGGLVGQPAGGGAADAGLGGEAAAAGAAGAAAGEAFLLFSDG